MYFVRLYFEAVCYAALSWNRKSFHITAPPSHTGEDDVLIRLVHLTACVMYSLHNKCLVAPATPSSIFCIIVTQNFSLIFVGPSHGCGDHHIKLTSTASVR